MIRSHERQAVAKATQPIVDREPIRSMKPGLALAALGIVFGDIGTSVLYSLQTVFSMENHAVRPTHGDVMGIISMIFWSILLVVCVKYVIFVMRADNDGEGGILALMALVRRLMASHKGTGMTALLLGIVGAGLFYGDSFITPAISVMSAVEGLTVANPDAEKIVLPASVVILTLLFIVQRRGTEVIGKAFGPVMATWFLTLAALGIPWIIHHPVIITALSPHWAILFSIERPAMAFIAMGAVVLTITGAEALYADMGHVGAPSIRLAWFGLVLPCLLINYLGQGAMILSHPDWIDNPFFRMAPDWATIPLVTIATMATVIASQAVISGAFSMSSEAARLGLLPRLGVRHTSKSEGGQIYIPEVNWTLFIGVLALILIFQTSSKLATAYGLAVTGTFLLTTSLFLVLAHRAWHWPMWALIFFGVIVGGVELSIFSANLLKIASGGWIPLLFATIVVIIMTTWRRGTAYIAKQRQDDEGPLDDFLNWMHETKPTRVPGLAVYPHPGRATTPLALLNNLRFNHVLHEHNIIISIVVENVPHVRHVNRIEKVDLGRPTDGITYIACHVGFTDSQDVPKALALAAAKCPWLKDHLDEAIYYLSLVDVKRDEPQQGAHMAGWRKMLYITMSRNQADRTRVFRIPRTRAVVMGEAVAL
ncbi:potassium transporter [Cutibacterium acnes FZ1/2/0]|uniref:Probable potassium transport system protein Kup n=6 Tax=Bacteria TaxID=2 RepID=KUP_CUTAK|nr:RecName: Full=Probable potassium transport system protein Kup [Cutibacterium acnes KPA171202]AEE73387.1 putative potassium transport system protein Kup [Cutibacterium acnes 266]AEH30494.1 potassium transporter [Cutibacterium acnes 6609]AEW80183.1 potassium transporter [Cutibacterium acnes TypeIA2 P.acn33]AEW82423.1 potassium transporter [Cutibacterium acnes TypeIA2 P.acn17]AEW84691.1 potassium transporter [Cutibacterium acnes TypeIA2 P.acn31]AFU41967.1 potassium transporter [Cutibacterium 